MEEESLGMPAEESTPVMEDQPTGEPEVAPTEEPAEPAEPEEVLYDLPDGRKVDGETLAKEWKENFLPDYTRKSQELANYKKAPENINNQPTDDNPYANPDYIPQSYEEIIRTAEERALKAFEAREQARIEQHQAIENEVANQLAEIKKLDPNLNENSLFQHATKFGFKDLNLAYQNMKYVQDITKNVQQTTVKNIQKRADPVSTTNSGQPIGNSPNPGSFENARDYLRSLK
jgi:hypothetical protein